MRSPAIASPHGARHGALPAEIRAGFTEVAINQVAINQLLPVKINGTMRRSTDKSFDFGAELSGLPPIYTSVREPRAAGGFTTAIVSITVDSVKAGGK